MRKSTRLLLQVPFFIVLTLALLAGFGRSLRAQEADGVVPASYQSGSFFNQKLGTALRFNYHTQGYGTQADVFSLGGMKVFNMDDATMFVDGQGTLSDDFGGGFNLGFGYRQLATLGASFDPDRILGAGFWTDGQSTSSDNFFTQLGFSLESLGDSYDLRLNGSFPLERTQTSTATLSGTGSSLFAGSNLFNATERVSIDTAHNVIDGEFAKRINNLEAWAFVGGYQLGGGGVDSTGYRLGVRGYAVPDVALSLQVTDDDVYATNVLFGVTWFIGRTHANNGPCGTLLDRFREPVLRNDFIATTSRQINRASGSAAIDPDTGLAKNFVFVNGNAAAGGDGTFESPYNNLTDVEAALANNDTVFAFSDSTFTDTLNLNAVNDADFLGEGNDIVHVCQTTNFGLVTLPESSTGARSLAAPILNLAAGQTGFTAGDNSIVNNAEIYGGGIGAIADGVAAAQFANLTMGTSAILGPENGVVLRNTTGTTVVENTVVINGASGIAVLADQGDGGLSIGATINDTTGRSLVVQGRTGGTVDYTGTIDDRATALANFSDGVSIDSNMDATINLTNTLNIHVDDGETGIQITGNTSTDVATPAIVNASGAVNVTATSSGAGIAIAGGDDTSAVTFADLNASAVNGNTVYVAGPGAVTISSADDMRVIANSGVDTNPDPVGMPENSTGNAFFNDGAAGSAVVTINSNITNSGGGNAVRIENRAEANDAQFTGTVTATNAAGVLAQANSDGTILFTNTLTLNTDSNNAVELVGNTGATLSFTDLDIDTGSGDGFIATGGGTLIVSSLNGTNDIDVAGTGVGVNLTGMTIDPGNVIFDRVSVNSGGGVGINLQNLDGTGQVTIGGGTNAGDGGTLTTTGTAINVSNANNVAMSNLTVSNAGAAQGVNVTGQLAGSAAAFTGLDINTVGADAVNASNNTDGIITFTDLTASTTGAGGAVVANNNANATVVINGMTATATGSGVGFQGTGGGNLSVSGATSVSTNTGQAIEINGQTIVGAGASFNIVDVTAAANAVTLTDVSGANVNIGSGTTVGDGGTVTTTGTAIVVDNVANVSVNNVTVANDTGPNVGAGLSVTNQGAGSTASFNRLTVAGTTNNAVSVSGNTAGTALFTNLDTQTTDGTGVTVTNNGTATTTFNGIDVEATGTGDGFTSSGSGTLIATGNNSVTTESGIAVDLGNTTIGGVGASFSQITVNNGVGSGVVLNDLSGGQVTIGSAATASSLNTAGDALLVTNAANVNINNVDVSSAARGLVATNNDANDFDLSVNDLTVDSGGTQAVVASHTGGGDFTFATTNSDFDDDVDINADGTGIVAVTFNDTFVDTSGADVAFTLALGNSVTNANVQVQRTDFTAVGATAFDLDSNSVANKNLTFELSNSGISNSSASAAAEIDASGATIMNATVSTNTFTNTGAGINLDFSANDATTIVNLDMKANSTSGGTDSVVLRELNVADFNIVERGTLPTDDPGLIFDNPGVANFTFDSAGNVITDFDDIPALP